MWSWDCAFSISVVRECPDVSYVAGEGVELTVHKKSVDVEEIKAVELMRSRRAQYIYDMNYNGIGLQPRGHAPCRLPVKKLRGLEHKRRKVKVFVWKGIRKNIISFYSSIFTINSQPRHRSLRSIASWCWLDPLLGSRWGGLRIWKGRVCSSEILN